jgi:AcrR family transcriptional regulator
MAPPPTPRISTRKRPKQARSTQLVADILTAAAQVLASDGASRFTTARVAEKAGVSIGSLYQYFPSKEAILFRLQTDEWDKTSALMAGMLADRSVPALDRLRAVVRAFVRSECEEAAMRIALNDAAPLYRDTPEAMTLRQSSRRIIDDFLCEVLPAMTSSERRRVADVLLMSFGPVAKHLSEAGYTDEEADARARAMGDMFCAYLESLGAKCPPNAGP